MLILDRRAGSIDLLPHLKSYDVSVEVDTLSFADVKFIGSGPDDSIVSVGIEIKTIADLVDSMRSGRLSGHQLGGLCSDYDYAWIVVIGPWKCGGGGEVVYLRGRDWRSISDGKRSVLYRAVVNYVTTLELRAGTNSGNPLMIERVNDYKECAAFVVSLFNWFSKPWEQHRSHEAVYNKEYIGPGSSGVNGVNGHKPRNFMRRSVSQCEQTMATFAGLDMSAKYVADRFGSVYDLCNATVEEIAETPVEQFLKGGGKRTVRLGEKKAEKIWNGLRSRS